MAKSGTSRRKVEPGEASDAPNGAHPAGTEPHPAALRPDQLLKHCQFQRLRRSGPGGQHRNKVETMVRVCHVPTGVAAEAGERRSQEVNRRTAIRRLRVNLALSVRRPSPVGQEPSPLWRSRCRGGRVHVGGSHDDFPALLAEVLDRVAAVDGDVRRASGPLGSTASQLVRLLKKEPRALALVNGWRSEHRLTRLQ
ncbi:MAG: peptide chain release factor family protein [Planctomycetota bacterium]|jgi:hypothetical protein